MTSQKVIVFGLVLAALLVLLGFANARYIQPSLAPQLPEAKISPSGKVAPPPVNKNVVASTLQKMKTMFPERESRDAFEPRRVKRNPFVWPGEVFSPAGKKEARTSAGSPKKAKAGEERPVPRLHMIIIGENRKLAMIDETFVFEGSKFKGDTVKEIDENQVVLRGDGGETRLSLSEYTLAPIGERRTAPSGGPAMKTTSPVSSPSEQSRGKSREKTLEDLFERLEPLLDQ